MKKVISLVAGAALTALFVFGPSTPAFAPDDMFIKIKGIKGDSKVKGHKREIEVLSWSWGKTISTDASGLSHPSIVEPGTLMIVKGVDRSSAKLKTMYNSKTEIPYMQFLLYPENTPDRYHSYGLWKVMITSYQVDESTETPTEKLTFTYNEIGKMSFVGYKRK